ncbi:hypothetical protein [Nafulsella turpanensis]|uniref:hypothetical protein n=1 Tax=Nafulsella turpanensis TaxID=1265690 RepID=UPI0003495743|nr:hypothetical protein [Nafulsella turpanensis]
MEDSKGISFGEGNLGLATPITGLARPALGVYTQQLQEEKLRKQKEAEARQNAVEGNQAFGEELFKEKFNGLDTQRNQYKNAILNNLRETWNQANLQYSAKGQSIPLNVKQNLEKQLQSFRNEWEQIETAYNYSQSILEQAEKDKDGIYNLNGLRTALVDVPVDEEGNFDFTKYNEKYILDKIKKDADVLYNLPVVADNYAKTLAETTLEEVKELGNGRYDEIANKANGLIKVHYDRNGKPSLYAPDGSIQLDTSNEAIGRARQHSVLGPAMDAMVKKGKAENYIDAYEKIVNGQLGIEQKVDRQGSVGGNGSNGGSGEYSYKEDYNITNKIIRNIQHAFGADGGQLEVGEAAHKAASTLIGGKIGSLNILGYEFEKGKDGANNALVLKVSAGKQGGQVFTDKVRIDLSNPGGYEQLFNIYQSTREARNRVDYQQQIKFNEEQKKKSKRDRAKDWINGNQKKKKPKSGIEWGGSSKPKSGLFNDPLNLYSEKEKAAFVNPEGEEIY